VEEGNVEDDATEVNESEGQDEEDANEDGVSDDATEITDAAAPALLKAEPMAESDAFPLGIACAGAGGGLLVIELLLTIVRRLKWHPCGWRRSRPNTNDDLVPTIVAADVVQCGPPPPMSPDELGPPPSTGAPVWSGAECDVQRFFADGGGGGDGDCASRTWHRLQTGRHK
jgi:hypothetical protein